MPQHAPVLGYADPLEEAVHGNRVLMERDDDGVRFLIPPPGLLREMPSIVGLSLVLAISVVVLTVGGILPCGVVIIAGIIFLVAIIRAATNPALIEVRDGLLRQTSPAALIGAQREWRVDQIRRLRVGWRGISLRGRAVADLDMTLHDGSTVQLFAGRDKRELEWIARGLRETIGILE